jgi:hypothetical protein
MPSFSFLFLLVAEGLSMLIKDTRRGILQGIKISDTVVISHLLFVDDIMIFSHGSTRKIGSLKEILGIYCNATGMEINMRKSSMLINALDKGEKTQIANLFPMNIMELDQGIKYLGFNL